jgi:site-specific recombinase
VLFSEGVDSYQAVKKLLDDVLRARFEDLSLSALLRENAGLLARKIVERAGKTGEHYIANTRNEYWGMWKAALGGGLLTVATAAIKIRITMAGFPPFNDRSDVRQNCSHDGWIRTLGKTNGVHQPDYSYAARGRVRKGHFFGAPLDVRHVTLSTGTLALAATSLGKDWLYRNWFFHTLFGIAIIFVLNLEVSFGIASWVAMRAYHVPYDDRIRLVKYVMKSFFRSPWRFLYPPR